MAMCEHHLHILQHSLGVDEYGQGEQYRNHFVTGQGSKDYEQCITLVTQGLMIKTVGNELSGGMDIFTVTEAGKQAMKENSPTPPKLTRGQKRYKEWLKAADATGISFSDWLKEN